MLRVRTIVVTCLLLLPTGQARARTTLLVEIWAPKRARLIAADVAIWTQGGAFVRQADAARGRLRLTRAPVGTHILEAHTHEGGLVGSTRVVIRRNTTSRAVINVSPIETTPAGRAKASKLLETAVGSYVAGNHQRVRELCRQVLRLVPNTNKAIQLIGSSSCYLRDQLTAQWAGDRVSDSYRGLLRRICRNNGITLK